MMRFGFPGTAPGHMFGFEPFGGAFMFFGFLFVAGMVVLLVWLATRATSTGAHGTAAIHGHQALSGPGAATPARDEAVEIARQRLARGEIDAARYHEIMTALGYPGA